VIGIGFHGCHRSRAGEGDDDQSGGGVEGAAAAGAVGGGVGRVARPPGGPQARTALCAPKNPIAANATNAANQRARAPDEPAIGSNFTRAGEGRRTPRRRRPSCRAAAAGRAAVFRASCPARRWCPRTDRPPWRSPASGPRRAWQAARAGRERGRTSTRLARGSETTSFGSSSFSRPRLDASTAGRRGAARSPRLALAGLDERAQAADEVTPALNDRLGGVALDAKPHRHDGAVRPPTPGRTPAKTRRGCHSAIAVSRAASRRSWAR